MRGLWREACAKGQPADFVAFAKHRTMVYVQTIPMIDAMNQMRLLRHRKALHDGVLSVQYAGMASIRNVAGTTDGYLHGGNGLNWHNTWEGAHSEQLMNSMHSGLSNANRGDDVMTILQLQAKWRAVE
jgi:hypothetical protein